MEFRAWGICDLDMEAGAEGRALALVEALAMVLRAVGPGKMGVFFLTGDGGGGDLEKGAAPGIRRSGGGGSSDQSHHYPASSSLLSPMCVVVLGTFFLVGAGCGC